MKGNGARWNMDILTLTNLHGLINPGLPYYPSDLPPLRVALAILPYTGLYGHVLPFTFIYINSMEEL